MGPRNKKGSRTTVITEGDIKGEKSTTKNKKTNRVKDWFKEKIEKKSNGKSEVQHLLEGLTGWESPKRARYMNKFTRQQASTIFKARTNMLPVKANSRNKQRIHTCRACGIPVETQKHVLEDCDVLHLVGECKLYNKEIFYDIPNKLKTTTTNIHIIMDQLNDLTENETTSNSTKTTYNQRN